MFPPSHTHPPKLIPLLLALITATSFSSAALAQDKYDSNFQFDDFEPQANQGANILNTSSSDLTPHLKVGGGFFGHYLDKPIKYDKGNNRAYFVYSQFKGELGLALGLFNYAELGLVLPLAFQEGANIRDADANLVKYAPDQVFMIQDLRFSVKGRLVDPKASWAHGLGVALQLTGYFPIPGVVDNGLTNQWNSFYTGGKKESYVKSLRVEPRLIVDWRTKENGFKIAANFAYQYRPKRTFREYQTNQELRWNLGAELPIGWGLDWLRPEATFYGNYPLGTKSSKQTSKTDSIPKNVNMEWEVGIKFMLPHNLVGQFGGGGPLLHQGVGTPKFRVFAGFGYYPSVSAPPAKDTDLDGLLDDVDKCPTTAGPIENQGCPWGDLDGDGIPDNIDQCPSEAEDFDNFADEDGCPDLDNDNDGIPDTQDQCPLEAEDVDGFKDDDGCPDPDNDNDGFLDADDKCPNEAEIYNGVEDDDGCPDKGPTKLRITETKIEILEKVFFNTGKAKIRSRSYDLLDQVASVLKNIKKITKLRIEGHTDSRGSARSNMKLSQARADSVRQYLIDKGVDPNRLEAKGYGEDSPIDTNKTKAGRERNRRVEFTIVEVNGKPVQTDTVTIKKTEEVK